ncbi:MAG: sugar phosphate isomerase/epimerase [Proteobacteria bacterium]|nr:sugar phosphate isomerase/epimerase [Pseudomonadota bacterium]
MKLSLCNEVLRERSFARQCALAAAVGYDALEIAPFTLGPDPCLLTPRRIASVRAALRNEGLVCSSLHWLLVTPQGLSITSADAAVRRSTVQLMQRLCELAAELGAEVLVHGSPAQRQLPEGRHAGRVDAARQRAADCLAAAADAAQRCGVTYCIEPLAARETNFINTVAEAVALVEAIGNPALKTMIDTCAAGTQEGDVIALIDRWLPSGHIAHVQVNDPNRRGPGEGEMAFAPVVAALKRQRYAGWVAVEPFIYQPDGAACAARAAGYMRALMGPPR